jgi:hypothetical protein
MHRCGTSTLRAGLLLGFGLCALAGCSGTSGSASQGSSAPAGSAAPPPASGGSTGGSTGTYVPAAGTDTSGAIFQTYSNHKARYHLLYPGGWHVSTHAGIVRIAKLGNAIVIATRTAKSAPKVKPVEAALATQLKAKAILSVELQPRQIKLHGHPAMRMVFTKKRPATSTAPAATLRVYRYLLFHAGRIVILSMQSPDTLDNAIAYDLVANSFGWD